MRTSVFAIRAAALIITCAGATISTHASSSESDGPVIASKYNTVFKSPPRQVPSETAVDGPLLGNGSLLAVLAGGPERLRVHISNNDLWALKDYAGAPKPLAVLVLDIPSMKGASYRIEQQLGTAISHGTFVKDGVTLKVECAVAAAENLLWLRLESTGGTVNGQLSLALPTPSKSPGRDWEVGMPADRQSATSANADTTLMVSRFFGKDMRVKTGGACAARVLDGGTAFAVSPGKPVWITAVTTSLLQTQDPEQEALRLLAGMKLKTLDAVRGRHVAWWRNFWSKSFVEIADKFLEQRYYLSQYAMGRWSDYNGMNSIYAAAARVGYDPKIILAKLHDTQSTIGAANGMIRDNVHGMEHFSIVPNAIQEMLMQSYDGVIRLFPCWPKDQEARFGTLRARGAFLVSAELNDGVVCGVRILSEKGRSLTIVNPWPGKGLRVVRNGKVAEIAHTSAEASTTNRERFTLKTVPGESLVLKPE